MTKLKENKIEKRSIKIKKVYCRHIGKIFGKSESRKWVGVNNGWKKWSEVRLWYAC